MILRERIARDGPLPFVDFMAGALYHPDLGYYARETRQVGRGGDFFTSVSVGPLFGELLARRFLREWERLGRPEAWRIIESGAHDGTLAGDILTAIFQLAPDAFAALEYVIPEPLARLQSAQRESLKGFKAQVIFVSQLQELWENPLPGIAFGNELLDALPFHRVEWKNGVWHECRVENRADEGFQWAASREIEALPLLVATARLGTNFPEGYCTEVRTNFEDFLAPLLRSLSSGLLIWPDYGFARPEYYHPERRTGTLRTFSKHRAAEDPLERPGEIDITAHVDFTAVAEAGMRLGCQVGVFKNQGTWLTEVGRAWLLSLEGSVQAGLMKQFQTLIHPAHLGGSFHILELHWRHAAHESDSADLHRLALSENAK